MNQKIKMWETSISLLIAYETLALGYKNAKEIRTPFSIVEDQPKPKQHDYANYNQSLALLVLNASIVEGTVRKILSEKISDDVNYEIEKGRLTGQTEPSRSEQLLYKFREEVELQGGWEKLKGQYAQYLDLSLDKITDQRTREGVNALFVLRNVLAHGTTIIQPSTKMHEDLKDIYPFKWQSKIQGASAYLNSVFGHDGILENLAEFDVPEHFMDVTKVYFKDLEKNLGVLPERIQKTIKMVYNYKFGYINYSR